MTSPLSALTPEQRNMLDSAIAAVDAIDTGGKADWAHVKPVEHVAQDNEAAKIIGRCSTFLDLARKRDAEAKKGRHWQEIAKWWERLAFFIMFSVAAGAIFYTVNALELDVPTEWMIVGVIWLACALGFFLIELMHLLDPRGRWVGGRTVAERMRREMFQALVECPTVNATGAHSPKSIVVEREKCDHAAAGRSSPYDFLVAFEYFRRFQLGAQIDYHVREVAEKGAMDSRLARWRPYFSITLFVLVLVCIAMALGAWSEQGRGLHHFGGIGDLVEWRLFGWPLDTFVIGLLALVSLVYAVALHESIVVRRRDTPSLSAVTLGKLYVLRDKELDAARAAAARSDTGPALELLAKTHEIMAEEHSIWLGNAGRPVTVHRPELRPSIT